MSDYVWLAVAFAGGALAYRAYKSRCACSAPNGTVAIPEGARGTVLSSLGVSGDGRIPEAARR